MARYVAGRLAQIVVILFMIVTILFVLFRLAPGDPVSRMVDPSLSPEEAANLIAQLGLDKPIGQQYLQYLQNFVKGNFGHSFHYGLPVGQVIMAKLPNTILLFTTAMVLSALAGIAWGKVAAWKKGLGTDTALTVAALVTHTLFLPWLALLVIWIFGYKLDWLPINGMISAEVWLDPMSGPVDKALDVAYHMVLPLATLFIMHFGSYLLVMRSSMLQTLREDYIITARAKGLTEREIRNHHAAPNAWLPVITSVGLSLAFSINGGALTETVFSWPGIGRELVMAVSQNDYPLAQASFLLIAMVVLFANLVVDLLYAFFDPRIRY
ncbi:MAG: ABC transporter permease [Desulfarculus sp.]|nr:ABC transporter permease [Desulfarculus sp.]